jgi:hypothetical protein
MRWVTGRPGAYCWADPALRNSFLATFAASDDFSVAPKHPLQARQSAGDYE